MFVYVLICLDNSLGPEGATALANALQENKSVSECDCGGNLSARYICYEVNLYELNPA